MKQVEQLPVVVIGAGPVGLAAAANLVERGMEPLLFEAGPQVASSMRDWGHVRLFTPWKYLIDSVSRRLLEQETTWEPPPSETVPYAREVVEQYLVPVSQLAKIQSGLKLNHKIVAITREGHDRMKDGTRSSAPFLLVADTPEGPRRFRAKAVLDASGTWTTPNPMGAGGILADGEKQFQQHIRYGMPDVLGRERERYIGKRTLVVGSGHSAVGTVLSLVELKKEAKDTLLTWSVRRQDPTKLWGGGKADELAERGTLGTRVYNAVHSEDVALLTDFSISALRKHPEGIEVLDVHDRPRVVVDEIVVATGSRPDHEMLRELRLEFDLPTESTKKLGPMIDPNHHSCGSVSPHGYEELKHPEENFFLVGMKSYGRAPTFLLRTGYEQVRSVVAGLAGDFDAARKVELHLPQTGVCSTNLAFKEKTSGRCC